MQVSKDKIRTIPTANCPQGQAGLFIDKPDYYTMGLSAIEVKNMIKQKQWMMQMSLLQKLMEMVEQ
ncbi:MAG: hypothetical protein ACLRWM_08170 [Streptococcus sp.]